MSAVLNDSATYEHIQPETVGNRQRVLVSDLSGRGNIMYKLKQHGLADRLNEDARRDLLERITSTWTATKSRRAPAPSANRAAPRR